MKKGTHPLLVLSLALAIAGFVAVTNQSTTVQSGKAENLLASDAEVQAALKLYKEQGDEQLSKIANSLDSSPEMESNLPEAYLTESKKQIDDSTVSVKASNQICIDLFNSVRAIKISETSNSEKVETALKLISDIDLKLRKVCSATEYESFFEKEFQPWISSIGPK